MKRPIDAAKSKHHGPLLRRALSRVHMIHSEVFASEHITPVQLNAIGILHEFGPLAKKELGRRLRMELGPGLFV